MKLYTKEEVPTQAWAELPLFPGATTLLESSGGTRYELTYDGTYVAVVGLERARRRASANYNQYQVKDTDDGYGYDLPWAPLGNPGHQAADSMVISEGPASLCAYQEKGDDSQYDVIQVEIARDAMRLSGGVPFVIYTPISGIPPIVTMS